MHKNWFKAASAALGLSLALATAVQAAEAPAKPAAGKTKGDPKLVRRGEYLVRIAGCHDCHTPFKLDEALGMPVPDMSRSLSGHPENAPDPASTYVKPDMGIMGATMTSFVLPYGIVYASNLTSDPTMQQIAAAYEKMAAQHGAPATPAGK